MTTQRVTVAPGRATPRPRLRPALEAERLGALATPAAKLLLVMSIIMATASTVANLAAIDDLNSDATIQLTMHASTVATLIFAILAGLYSATTDLRFGFVDQRLLSEPRREIALFAKALVAALTGLLYGILGSITAVVAATSFYAANNETFDTGSPLVRQALLGVLIAAPLFSILGVAIGSIVSNQPVAIGGTLAWLLIIEPVMIVGAPTIGKWLPGAAGIALTNNPDSLMEQIPAGALLTGYAMVATLVAIIRFRRADV